VAGKVDFEAMRNQKASPYELRQLKQLASNTTAAVDNFYREPDPGVPATLNETIQFLFSEFLQFVLACPPAMWGESTADTKTASGLAQSRNQALGRRGIIWLFTAHVRPIVIRGAWWHRTIPTRRKRLWSGRRAQNITVQIERLRKGHFMATPDEDSGFPTRPRRNVPR
jgi:hypothetical protein